MEPNKRFDLEVRDIEPTSADEHGNPYVLEIVYRLPNGRKFGGKFTRDTAIDVADTIRNLVAAKKEG